MSSAFANPVALTYALGLALFYAWNLIDIYGEPFIASYESAGHLAFSTVTSSLTNTASYILVAVLLSRLRRFRNVALAGACLAGATVVAAGVLAAVGALAPAEAVGLYKTVGRICSACVIVAWGMRFSLLDGQSITVYALAGFFVASLLCLVVGTLGDALRLAVFAALLPGSAALLFGAEPGRHGAERPVTPDKPAASDKPAEGSKAPQTRPFLALVWRTMAVLALFGVITWTVILGTQSTQQQGPGLDLLVPLGCLATVATLLAISLASGGMFTVSYVYKLVVPFVGIGLLFVAVLNFTSSVGPMLVSIGYTCLDLFCFVMVADACGKTGVRAGAAFGWCRALESSLPLPAVLISATLGANAAFTQSTLVAVLGVASIAIILASLVLNRQGVFSGSHLNPDIAYPKAELYLFTLQCEQAIEQFDLTAREAEVLSLIVRGRSVPHIAERLAISRSTVKTHIERIYQKFGVSERQEMIDRIEAIEVEGEPEGRRER